MKLRDFILGIITGLAAAFVIKEVSEKVSPYLSPDQILENIKNEFRKEAPIDGSWIYMKTDTFKNGLFEIPVYRGGISRIIHGQLETYEFAADAKSGAVVELKQI